MKFGFDISKWILWLLPTALRKVTHVAWLNAVLVAFKGLHGVFLRERNNDIESIVVTPQVRILRGYLNKKFDFEGNRIEIIDSHNSGQKWIFLESEFLPEYLPFYLDDGDRYDFLIRIPVELSAFERQIKVVLNRFKLPSKVYKIQLV